MVNWMITGSGKNKPTIFGGGAGALTGGLCISIGANLIANSLHDKLLSEG